MDSFPGGYISHFLRLVFSLTFHVGMLPWGTQWERCVDFFQGSVAALIFFSGGDGGDANWKYLKDGYIGGGFKFTPWEYTCYQWDLSQCFTTIWGIFFEFLSNHQTSKSKRCRNLIQVSVMFWPLFFPKRIMMRLGRWPGMILFSYFQNPTGWGNTMTWLNPCRCWPFLISSTSIRSNGITYGHL